MTVRPSGPSSPSPVPAALATYPSVSRPPVRSPIPQGSRVRPEVWAHPEVRPRSEVTIVEITHVHSVHLFSCVTRRKHEVSRRTPYPAANCETEEPTVRDGTNSCHTKRRTSSSFFRTRVRNDSSWAAFLCCWAIISAFLFLAKFAASCTISIDLFNRFETSRHVCIS